MSELRQDPITARWTVIAPGRTHRPNEYPRRPPPAPPESCPFCEGHESGTPAEVAVDRPTGRPADGPGRPVRAIPNKFPTLTPDGEPPEGLNIPREFTHRPGWGFHEVIIEPPGHAARLATRPFAQVRTVRRIVRDRTRTLAAVPGVASLAIFENSGPESGGTVFHPHAQIIAVPETLPRLAQELSAAATYAGAHSGECVFESVLERERAAGARLVKEAAAFTAYCPSASELPYEVRIEPHRHSGSFAEAADAEIDALAEFPPALLQRFEVVAPEASYNSVLRVLADGRAEPTTDHWHLDLLPRLIRPDGFEVAGGICVNPFPPETAARELRSAESPAPAAESRSAPAPPKD